MTKVLFAVIPTKEGFDYFRFTRIHNIFKILHCVQNDKGFICCHPNEGEIYVFIDSIVSLFLILHFVQYDKGFVCCHPDEGGIYVIIDSLVSLFYRFFTAFRMTKIKRGWISYCFSKKIKRYIYNFNKDL
jgi:hypothetical protein